MLISYDTSESWRCMLLKLFRSLNIFVPLPHTNDILNTDMNRCIKKDLLLICKQTKYKTDF